MLKMLNGTITVKEWAGIIIFRDVAEKINYWIDFRLFSEYLYGPKLAKGKAFLRGSGSGMYKTISNTMQMNSLGNS